MSQEGTIRFADRVLAGTPILDCTKNKTHPPRSPELEAATKKLLERPMTAVVDYENVDRYYATDPNHKTWRLDEFFNVRAPYPIMWMETRNDKTLDKSAPDFSGCLLFQTAAVERDEMLALSPYFMPLPNQSFPEKLIMQTYNVFQFFKHASIVLHVGKSVCLIGENGAPASALITLPREFSQGIESREYGEMMTREVFPILLAMQFMHCKNVQTVANDPPEKLSKAFQRRHGRPMVRFHTLEIEPMKQVLETEGQIGHNGLKKALHICRGHFATYSPDKPLFGNFVGTVWKSAHVRGSAAEGIVVKDYRVKAPSV